MDCAEVMQWRKAERQRLIAERLAISNDVRRRYGDQIATNLQEVVGNVQALIISAASRTYVALWRAFRTAVDDVLSL